MPVYLRVVGIPPGVCTRVYMVGIHLPVHGPTYTPWVYTTILPAPYTAWLRHQHAPGHSGESPGLSLGDN